MYLSPQQKALMYLEDLKSLKGLTIAHLNIRSLFRKIDSIRNDITKSEIQIMTISETWLNSDLQNAIVQIGGYSICRQDRGSVSNDRCSKKTGGGLIIYYESHLDCDTTKWQHLNRSNDHLEIQVVEFNLKSRNLILLNTYRPPSGNVDECLSQAQAVLDEVTRNNKDIVFMGDFNINYKKRNDVNTKKLKELVNNNNLTQIIKDHTRYTQTTRSTIDLIITNMNRTTSKSQG